MGDINTRTILGTYQYCNGSNTVFGGGEARYSDNGNYIGIGGFVASDEFKNPYGLFDIKGKVNYDSNGIFDQNIRVRTAFDDNLKSTQIRYSPITVNIPIDENISIYSNTHYSGKYNFDTKEWKHSIGNFTGVSYDVSKQDNISLEVQRYNLQKPNDNSPENWSVNLMFSHKF